MEPKEILSYIKGMNTALNGSPPSLEQWDALINLIALSENDILTFNKKVQDVMFTSAEAATKSPDVISDMSKLFDTYWKAFGERR
jgi:hypothetical protein